MKYIDVPRKRVLAGLRLPRGKNDAAGRMLSVALTSDLDGTV
jgi:hypothetical protein